MHALSPNRGNDVAMETSTATEGTGGLARRRPTGFHYVRRSGAAIFTAFILFQFGLPQLAGVRNAVGKLRDVNPLLLVAGLSLEVLAFLAYALLTRATLRRSGVSIASLFRIQLATKAITNTVPGGSAAGSAMGYRLLTLAGVDRADAGFALATAGLGSAVVLNLILWACLVVSIPFNGIKPGYVTVALVGVFLFLAAAGVVFSLMRGQTAAERVIRVVVRHVPFLKEDRMAELVRRLALRLRELISDRELLRRLVKWAIVNWLIDAAALWVALRAFGHSVRPDTLLVAFCIANISAVIPLTPGGLGVFEAALTSVLVLFGVPGSVATLGVSAYRLAQFWLPIPLGGLAYLSLRVGRWRVDRDRKLGSLRQEAGAVVASGETVYDWAERIGESRRRSADGADPDPAP